MAAAGAGAGSPLRQSSAGVTRPGRTASGDVRPIGLAKSQYARTAIPCLRRGWALPVLVPGRGRRVATFPPLNRACKQLPSPSGSLRTTEGTTSLNTSFFTNPLKTVEGLFASDQRLDRLSDALGAVLGEAQLRLPPPAPDGASVHCFPIVPSSASGGVYLYLERTATSSTLGLVAEGAHGASGATFDVSAPLVSGTVGTSVAPSFVTGTAANAAAGTADNPVRLDATLPVAWAAPAKPFGLAAVQLTGLIYRDLGQSRLQLTLVGLDLGDGPKDLSFDPQHIGPETAELVMAALRAALTTAGLSPK